MPDFPYSGDFDLEVYGEDRLDDLLNDPSSGAAAIFRARRQADARIDAALGACYDVPFKVTLDGTWTVVTGSNAFTGTGTTALADLVKGQLVTVKGEHLELAEDPPDDLSFTTVDDHVGGATGEAATVTPFEIDPLFRRWSYLLTIDALLPGATEGDPSLKAAIASVETALAGACSGAFDLPGQDRVNDRKGVTFVEANENAFPQAFDPRGDLDAAFGVPRSLT